MRLHRLTSGMLALTGGILLTVEPVRAQTGACCQADGTCIEEDSGTCTSSHCAKQPGTSCTADADCIIDADDFGPCVPRFLGQGSTCEPNCCPQPVDAWGECCRDEYHCTAGLESRCDPNDPTACDGGNDGTCVLACAGPIIYDIPVPPWSPPSQANVVDLTTDSRRAEFNPADTCAYKTNEGWYASFHVSECARVIFTYCCTDPQLQFVSQVLVKGCPCDGPMAYIPPDPGHFGYGNACGNDHCCEDGNYSVQWTIRDGTYHYGVPAGTYCEQSGDGCLTSLDCAPEEACIDVSQPLQAHIIVEPCRPAACCYGSTCSVVTKFECEDGGGDWLGDLVLNPVADCFDDPCATGACCLGCGSCEDQNGDQITPEACAALPGGYYHGGLLCTDAPCSACEFNMTGSQIDRNHCQGDTGQYIFPSDRFQGTRRADDFRPQDSPIRRICFAFGFVTEEGSECSDDLPRDDFEYAIYEDAFGLPDTVVAAGPLPMDRCKPIPGMRTWQFSAMVNPPDGVEVIPGECYWLEITGMGDDDCSTLWAHSVDGNNYGLRDDNDSYGPEDIRDNDVVWCIDTGIVVPTNPGTDGGCGDIPVACCPRDPEIPCYQATFNECSDVGNFGFPYSPCGGFACPDPPNNVCDTDGDGTPDGAARICEGNPEHPEWGEWIFWDGLTQGTRLGQCNDWPGSAGFGQICDPVPPGQCREPSTAVCVPHQPEPGVFPPAYECYVTTDNRLATTDGPVGGGACGSGNAFQADVWHLITAPCCGRAVVTMCDAPSEYDSMLSVYGNDRDDVECPGPGDDNEDLLECNDEYCRGSGTASGVHWDAVKDAVYLLRQGGYSDIGDLPGAAQGISQFHIGFLCDFCPHCDESPGLPPNEKHHARKHRYISIDATTCGSDPVAIKVEIAEMNRCQNDLRRSCVDDDDCPTVCQADPDIHSCEGGGPCPDGVCIESGPCGPHPNVGLSWFVQEPQTRGAGCPNGMCDEEDYYARVGPDPYVSDWKDECEDATHIPGWTRGCSTLHIGDCEIVPGVKYNVYACMYAGDYCNWPLEVETTRKPELMPHYGDVAGPVTPELVFLPPDGYTSVIDIAAYALTVKNWGTTNLPQAHPTWLDLHGGGSGIPPQYILNVTDLKMILLAWIHVMPYEAGYGGLAPGDCP